MRKDAHTDEFYTRYKLVKIAESHPYEIVLNPNKQIIYKAKPGIYQIPGIYK